jgi:hypothetical protein
MSEIVAEPPWPPVITCFLDLESMKINNLILIRFPRANAARQRAQTTRTAGPVAPNRGELLLLYLVFSALA